jgi:hypothetical protein
MKGQMNIMLIGLIIAGIFIMGGLLFAKEFDDSSDELLDMQTCRLSLIANADARMDKTVLGIGDEAIAKKCPQLPDYEMTWDNAQDNVESGNPQAIIKYWQQQIAERHKFIHLRSIGDLDKAPFSKDDGVYCMIGQKLKWDEEAQQHEEVQHLESYLSFLINRKIAGTDTYYSELLFDYTKLGNDYVSVKSIIDSEAAHVTDTALQQGIESLKAATDNYDFTFDTTKEYYLVHMVIKDQDFFEEYRITAPTGVGIATGCVAFGGMMYMLLAPELTVTKVVGVVGVVGSLVCAGAGYKAFNEQAHSGKEFVKITIPVEASEIKHLGCTKRYR